MKTRKKKYALLSAEHHLANQVCPVCGYKMDTVSGITDDVPPRPGGFTVCLACGEIAQFDKTMLLVRPPPEEIFQLLISKAGKIVMSGQDYIRQQRAAGEWIGQKNERV